MAVRRLAPPELQPKSFHFTVENLDWAKGQIDRYPEGRQASAIIPLLWRAQEQAGGWLPQKAIEHVADLLGPAHVLRGEDEALGLDGIEAAHAHRSTSPNTMSIEPRTAETSASMWPRHMWSMA